jgi:hypothetical protein
VLATVECLCVVAKGTGLRNMKEEAVSLTVGSIGSWGVFRQPEDVKAPLSEAT